MATPGRECEVLVVGAGPVGLMLAGELRLAGVEVAVVDRLPAPTSESRASTLHARTMELLDNRGLLARFGTLPNDVMGHLSGIPLSLDLDTPYPGQWKVPQTRTEAILGEWAGDLGAHVARSRELVGLTERAGTVEAVVTGPAGTATVRARYVVGCDGEDSTVRRLAGIDFPGHGTAREMIRADVAGIDIPNRRFQRLPAGLAIAARSRDGVTRVMVHVFDRRDTGRRDAPDFAEVCADWQAVTGEDISGGTPLWVNAFGDACRLAARYRRGRVLLAGDAAHQQMPIGGQALNLGLHDAVNLGWKLAAVVRGRAPERLLETYHDERHAVAARVLTGIEAQAALLLGGPEVEPVREVLAELAAYEPVRRHLAATISGLDVRYGADRDDQPLLGGRLAPVALRTASGPTTSARLLRDGRGLLLIPASDDDRQTRLVRAVHGWRDRVQAVPTEAAPGLPDPVLVRPDGHVAWTAPDGTAGLTEALERWFGPSAPDHLPKGTTMDRLAGKTALVTGASRGIGRAIAVRLAAEGALVAVHYTARADAAEEVVATIEKDGGRAFAVRAELGVSGDVHELFLALEEGLKERTGDTRLDILVNNAGQMGGVAPEETTSEQFDRLFAVNAKAPFFLIQRALRNLAAGGRIVNISSGLTRVANPSEIAYAMTKGAVEQLSLHFAKHLAPRGITVNSVAPGITRNGNPVFDIPEAVEQMAQLSAFRRVGEPEDVADVVAFLASPDGRWVTGAFLDATGGTLLG
ncbi:SDR family oxidoreductase [Micromonospora sp. NPDC005172]|uniref:SDR family oxidoreductase n=1 Tax=Micromonospora sp. NPDC005172 TaxID=3156867 RepID=UPI0033BC9B2D